MFLNPTKVGPLFAALTGFLYHLIGFFNHLKSQLKKAQVLLQNADVVTLFRMHITYCDADTLGRKRSN